MQAVDTNSLIRIIKIRERWHTGLSIEEVIDIIKDAPKMDVIPAKSGTWIGGELGHCSQCGHRGCASDIWDGCDECHCPNCGAILK